jgi:hypothetical protein
MVKQIQEALGVEVHVVLSRLLLRSERRGESKPRLFFVLASIDLRTQAQP